ncbi:hypothetical protein SKAU_G00403700 [Synaphobranchus kaupii]|uniref:NXPE C-terminal domain-containing protein n=1 Tax=Synaphobranchus kaupii TaxID=118154 RepID=A0A9Q1E9M0_SYNKA|nr:hypothetical protein SKAU_G00403700 [Synaphobranchus kaupii]
MRNYTGHPKAYGGDFILARIHSPKLQACASGDVTDFLNGSYRVRFRLFWPGEVQVSVRLMHSSETIKIFQRGWMQDYSKVMHTGTFISGSKKETSQCGLRLSSDRALCEYRKKEDGEYYACYRPKTLPCNSLITMTTTRHQIPPLTKEEAQLLARVFIQRLQNVRRAILRLSARSPRTGAGIKLENNREVKVPLMLFSDCILAESLSDRDDDFSVAGIQELGSSAEGTALEQLDASIDWEDDSTWYTHQTSTEIPPPPDQAKVLCEDDIIGQPASITYHHCLKQLVEYLVLPAPMCTANDPVTSVQCGAPRPFTVTVKARGTAAII